MSSDGRIVFNSSFRLYSMFHSIDAESLSQMMISSSLCTIASATDSCYVNCRIFSNSVCIIMLSLVPLASSSAMRMVVISACSTDVESLSVMMISSFLCTIASATRFLSLEPWVCCVLK